MFRIFFTSQCILSFSVLTCQDTHYQMLYEKLQTISIWCNVRKWTHFLFVNTSCSNLHSFCASGMTCGLATSVTLNRVSRGRLRELIICWCAASDLNLYRNEWLLLDCVWNDTIWISWRTIYQYLMIYRFSVFK
jgi:hypothetical protein